MTEPRHPDPGYWAATRRLTFGLLLVWVIVTFVLPWYARELNALEVFGFPLGFYLSAQGILFTYVLLVGYYAWRMNRLDRQYGVEQGAGDKP